MYAGYVREMLVRLWKNKKNYVMELKQYDSLLTLVTGWAHVEVVRLL